MSTAATSFYVTGGTLRHDAPSYVERQADLDLYQGLQRGEFCYVLTARQMGKSSLMARAAHRLRQEGVGVVVLDLTALGRNLTVEQWYDGLRDLVGQQLDLEDDLEVFWQEHLRFGPLQRWMAALRQVVLAQRPGRIVIFVDEIDAVRSLPFDTDEFFAAIRECYNRRTEDAEFNRLTFCLLGVASPSDLIQDTRTTPFNIGRRIELTDFSEAEAAPLAQGLGRKEPVATALLERVLYWTGGHPYLTQRLCRAVAEDNSVTDAAGVDRLCQELFLSPRAQERDDNLLFVRERLLRSEGDLASLLDLYGQVRRGKRVREEETNALVSLLRLAGITRAVAGCLRVRNQIYQRVFNREWVTVHMPDAELRRQRAAYRRGLVRATAVVGAVALALGGLTIAALRSERRARGSEVQARQATANQLQALSHARRLLYAAQMSVAQRAWEVGHVGQARQILAGMQPRDGEADLRGFEWRYLWRRCQQGDSLFTLRGQSEALFGLAYSPDGRTLVSGDHSGTVTLWSVARRQPVASVPGHKGTVFSIAFSQDGRLIASAGQDHLIRLWHITGPPTTIGIHPIATLRGHRAEVREVVFSPDGRMLASASVDETIRLWSLAARSAVATLRGHTSAAFGVTFSPDGRTLASCGTDRVVRLWNVATRRQSATLRGHLSGVFGVAFSPDGRTVASTSFDTMVRLWDSHTGRPMTVLKGHGDVVNAVAFSPDGRTLATGSADTTVRLWDVATRQPRVLLRGHQGEVFRVAFSPQGSTLATASTDGTIQFWDVNLKRDSTLLRAHHAEVWSVAFSPDSRLLATGGGDRMVNVWDVATGRNVAVLGGHARWVTSVAFSPDGKTLASGSGQWNMGDRPGEVRLWDVERRRLRSTLARFRYGVECLAFDPSGATLAMGGHRSEVRWWEVASGRELAPLAAGMPSVFTLAFSPDGHSLVWGGWDDTTVRVWDTAAHQDAPPFRGHDGEIISAVFSPDGKTLATSAYDRSVRLWDVASRQQIALLRGVAGGVAIPAFSPDAKTLAIGNAAGLVSLWSVTTHQEMLILKGHEGFIPALAFAPDGNTLATGSADGTVRLWRAASFEETDTRHGARFPPSPR